MSKKRIDAVNINRNRSSSYYGTSKSRIDKVNAYRKSHPDEETIRSQNRRAMDEYNREQQEKREAELRRQQEQAEMRRQATARENYANRKTAAQQRAEMLNSASARENYARRENTKASESAQKGYADRRGEQLNTHARANVSRWYGLDDDTRKEYGYNPNDTSTIEPAKRAYEKRINDTALDLYNGGKKGYQNYSNLNTVDPDFVGPVRPTNTQNLAAEYAWLRKQGYSDEGVNNLMKEAHNNEVQAQKEARREAEIRHNDAKARIEFMQDTDEANFFKNITPEQRKALEYIYNYRNSNMNHIDAPSKVAAMKADEGYKIYGDYYSYAKSLVDSGLSDYQINRYATTANRNKNAKKAEIWDPISAEYAKEHPVINTIASTAMNVLGGVPDALETLGDLAENRAYGTRGLDMNAPGRTLTRTSRNIRDTITEDIDSNFGRQAYSLATSTLDTLAAAGLAGITGVSAIGGASIGLSAGAEATNDLIQRGATAEQAAIGGLAAATFETLFETLSISMTNPFQTIENMSVTSLKDLLIKVGASAFTNATEESITEAANIIYDTAANGSVSEYNVSVRKYMAQGMSEEEAKKQTAKDMIMRTLEAGAMGGIQGALLGGLGGGASMVKSKFTGANVKANSETTRQDISAQLKDNNVNAKSIPQLTEAIMHDIEGTSTEQEKQLIENNPVAQEIRNANVTYNADVGVKQIVDRALQSENSATRKQAQRIQDKINNGIEPTDIEIGGLTDAIQQENAEIINSKRASEQEKAAARDSFIANNVMSRNMSAFRNEHNTMNAADRQEFTNPTMNVNGRELHIDGGNSGDGKFNAVYANNNGEWMVKTGDGNSMKASDAANLIVNENDRAVWQSVLETMPTPNAANVVLDAYDGQSDIQGFVRAAEILIAKGKTGADPNIFTVQDFNPNDYFTAETQNKLLIEGLESREFKAGATVLGTNEELKKSSEFQIKVLNKIARDMGFEVFLFDSMSDGAGKFYNGAQFRGTNRIALSLDAQGGLLLRAFAHEQTHFIAENNSQGYKLLEDATLKALGIKNANGEINEKKLEKALEKYGKQGYESEDKRLEELVADSMFGVYGEGVVRNIVSEDVSLAKSIYNKLNEYVTKAKAAIKALSANGKHPEIEAIEGDLTKLTELRDIFFRELNTATQNYKNGQQIEQQTEQQTEEGITEIPFDDSILDFSTQDLDEEYEDAYFDGDDEKMQSIVDEIARRKGFTYKAYHHTENAFNKFDLSKSRRTSDIQGFYFSADPDAESEYGSVRYDTYLKMEHPYIIDSQEKSEALPRDLSETDNGVKVRQWLLNHGYDSVIRKADYYGSSADEYIVLNPNQIKSSEPATYNDYFDESGEYAEGELIPISERFDASTDDIRYSTQDETDAEYMSAIEKYGEDSKQVQSLVESAAEKAMPDSKVRDSAGKLLKVFHGRVSEFNVFDRSYGNAEGDFGRAFYFTNNEDDVEGNYANDEGADLTNKIEHFRERMEWADDEEYDALSPEEKDEYVRKNFITAEPNVVEAYVNIQNPVYIAPNSEGTYFDFEEEYDEETDEYGEPTGLLVDFVEALQEAAWDYWQGPGNPDFSYLLYDYGDGMYAADAVGIVKRRNENIDYLMTEDGDLALNEVIRSAFEIMGYDGIIDSSVPYKFPHMTGMNRDTVHYLAFSPEQIKRADPVTYDDDGNIIPLTKRFDSSKDDIRWSRKDIEGQITFDTLEPIETTENDKLPDGRRMDALGNTYTDRERTFVKQMMIEYNKSPLFGDAKRLSKVLKNYPEILAFDNKRERKYKYNKDNTEIVEATIETPFFTRDGYNLIDSETGEVLTWGFARNDEPIHERLLDAYHNTEDDSVKGEADTPDALKDIINNTHSIYTLKRLKTVLIQLGGSQFNLYTRDAENKIKDRIKYIEEHPVGRNLEIKQGVYSQDQIEEMFYKLNKDKEVENIAKKVFALTRQFGTTYMFSPIKGSSGMSFGNRIRFRTDSFNNPNATDMFKASTILHEMIHTCTVYVLNAYENKDTPHGKAAWEELTEGQQAAAKQLDELWKETRNDSDIRYDKDLDLTDYNADKVYGITNKKSYLGAMEFVAELSNPDFREALKKRGLLERILDSIKKLFGIEPKNRLEASDKILEYLITNPNVDAFKEHSFLAELNMDDAWNPGTYANRADEELSFSTQDEISDIDRYYAETIAENRAFQMIFSNLENAISSQRTSYSLSQKEVDKVVNRIMKKWGGTDKKFRDNVTGIFDYMLQVEKNGGNVTSEEIQKYLLQASRDMLLTSEQLDDEEYEKTKQLRKTLREAGIYVSEEKLKGLAAEFGYKNTAELKRHFMGRILLTTDPNRRAKPRLLKQMSESEFAEKGKATVLGQKYTDYEAYTKAITDENSRRLEEAKWTGRPSTLDSWWADLSSEFPEYFDAENYNDYDQFHAIDAFLDITRPRVYQPFGKALNSMETTQPARYREKSLKQGEDAGYIEDAALEVATELIAEYGNITRTYTDKQKMLNYVYDVHTANVEYRKKLRGETNAQRKKMAAEMIEYERNKINEYRNARETTERRRIEQNNIDRNWNYVNSRIEQKSKTKHIPHDYEGLAEAFVKAIPGGDNFKAKFSRTDLNNLLVEYRNKAEDVYSGSPVQDEVNELVSKFEDFVNSIPKDNIKGRRAITLDELDVINQVSSNIRYLIDNANKVFVDGKKYDTQRISSKIAAEYNGQKESIFQEDTQNKKAKSLSNLDRFMLGITKPEYLFKNSGSETIYKIYQDIRKGENIEGEILNKSKQAIIQAKKNNHYDPVWSQKTINYKSLTGVEMNMTVPQAMYLYALSRRDQGVQHIIGDEEKNIIGEGIALVDAKTGRKVKSVMTRIDVNNIIAKLSSDQIAYVNEITQFLSNELSKDRNKVSMDIMGFEKYTEKDTYIPIIVDKSQIKQNANVNKGEPAVANQGASKTLVKGAKNAVKLIDFDEVVNNHIHDTAMYCAYASPTENFNRVWNADIGDTSEKIHGLVSKHKGINYEAELHNMIVAVNGGTDQVRDIPQLKGMMIRAKKAATMANLSVVVQQPTAVFRAMRFISPKYFATVASKADLDEMYEWNGCALKKSIGYFDVNVGKTVGDWLSEYDPEKSVKENWSLSERWKNFNKMDAIDKLASYGAEKADEITWGAIWKAAKKQIAAEQSKVDEEHRLTGDALNQAAAELFQKTIVESQVYDSVFSKPAYMRSKGGMAQLVTAFMSEPLTSFNMMVDAVKNRKIIGTKQMLITFADVGLSIAAANACKTLVQMLRRPKDEDEEKDWLVQYLSKLSGNVVSDIFGMVPLIGNVISSLEGYSNDVLALSSIDSIVKTFNSISKVFQKEDATWEDWRKALYNGLNAISQATGIPVYNVTRDIMSIIDKTYNTITKEKPNIPFEFNDLKWSIAEELEWIPGVTAKIDYSDYVEDYLEGKDTEETQERIGDKVTSVTKAIGEKYRSGKITRAEAKRALMALADKDEKKAETYLKSQDTRMKKEAE